MPKITRKNQKVFGGQSSNNGQFGSARLGTFVLDNDPDVIQSLPAWESGINAATVSGEKLPALEETQGIDYVITRQLAYIFQQGIPEYNADTIYFENCLVIEEGTVKLYKSLIDNNSGNPLSDTLSWDFLVDFDLIEIPPLNNYTATVDPTVNDDSTDGYSAGSIWYNSTGTGEAFLCVDPSAGAAKWIKTTLTVDELGSAAFQPTTAFATAAQGALAATALQPGQAVPVSELTDMVAYTPTFTGFGTVTGVDVRSRRVGDCLEIDGVFTTGTVIANEARITLGFNGVNGGLTIDPTKVPALKICGISATAANLPGVITTLMQGGNGFINFGVQTASTFGLFKQNASSIVGNGVIFSFTARVPIQGW